MLSPCALADAVAPAYLQSDSQDKACFYGKVINDANEPVPGAYVFVEVTSSEDDLPEKTEKTIIQTDSNGFFKIEQPATQLKITNIRKQGYYFPQKKPATLTFDLTVDYQNNSPLNASTPAVFMMTKRKQPTQVRSMYTYVAWASRPSNYTIDLTQRGFPASARMQATAAKTPKNSDKAKPTLTDTPKPDNQKEKHNKQTDLIITTSITEDKTGYTMHFETPEKDSGIIISDKLLARFPQADYEAKAELTIANQPPNAETRKYLYIKARDEKIYSRIALSAKPGEKNMLVRIACLSNLNGSRVFPAPTPAAGRLRSKPQQRWDAELKRKTQSQQKRQQRLEMLKKK